jgi:hypothetical protein
LSGTRHAIGKRLLGCDKHFYVDLPVGAGEWLRRFMVATGERNQHPDKPKYFACYAHVYLCDQYLEKTTAHINAP